MELVPTIFSTGWAAGVNSYATVALLGILGRLGVGEVPEPLTQDAVIAFALVMYAIEFVTDKIPYVDTSWDVVHTAIRPAIASLIGVSFADADHVNQIDTMLAGGGSGVTALASHGVKASLRLGINTSPEPVTNIIASVTEDLLAAGVVALALEHPEAAAAIAATLLVAGVGLVILVWTRIRRAWRRWRAWREAGKAGRDPPPG
ncbi:MAG: DUF4126 domain-containing protein [Solirubrobacterales bacterium]|nr:DUF4126 domain-containing protein [Solirubrobacterales bacterium]